MVCAGCGDNAYPHEHRDQELKRRRLPYCTPTKGQDCRTEVVESAVASHDALSQPPRIAMSFQVLILVVLVRL